MSEVVENADVEEIVDDETYQKRKTEASKIIRNYMLASLVPAVLPMPLVDLALITATQLKMLHSLSNLYGVKFSKNLGKESIASLAGSSSSLALTPMMASVIQIVPFVGHYAGSVSLATFSGASTYAIGKVFVQHFESGGTFLTFNPDKVRDFYAEQCEKGKAVTENLKQAKAKA